MAKPKIKIVLSNEQLITPGGLSLVGSMLGNSCPVKNAFRVKKIKISTSHQKW